MTSPPQTAPLASLQVEVPGEYSMVALLGPQDELLRQIESSFSCDIHVRGNQITISGDANEVDAAGELFDQLIELLAAGHTIDRSTVRETLRMVRDDVPERASEVLAEALLTHRGRTIRPKTLGQKRYLDMIRANTVTFGIGPAGTGKTYLAMGAAVQALRAKQVNRLILTRPAVEAGERLGFLPGTLHEKIDPYLKPLWDALHDMMEADELINHVDRGTIEVAPLAYMRGRAQPVDTPVLTPTGWAPIGSLQVGDRVIGSDGRPTRVLGVFPQGRKDVYRVATQDGASTLACGEHLWSVYTRADRRRGKPPRVLQTQEMIGRLRAGRHHRYELPLVQHPVAFPSRDVPLDPYEFGRRLGDGVPTDATMLSQSAHGDRAVAIAVMPRTQVRATATGTAFVLAAFLFNDAEVRLGLLQGLLDSEAGTVTPAGRGPVHFTTASDQVRDDVVFLVRSLGGVAEVGARRNDAHVIDIRLPVDLAPFRLSRKLERYERTGGGTPRRYIHAIEPAGSAETVCIRVAAADSLYVTDDFLLTHNTLNDAFIVADEAQNTTPEQMKMFLTRIGFGSKAVVTGDISQVDLPGGTRSGLRVVREILRGIEGVGFTELDAKDVVRHAIVQRIVEAYERHDVEVEDERRRRDATAPDA